MRTFVLSDIHGNYETFLRMLERIDFKDEDQMYVLGDVIDRGKDGVKVLEDLMMRENVELFMGNHELMMLNTIIFQRKLKEGEVSHSDYLDVLTPYELWTHPSNGGRSTFDEFYSLPLTRQEKLEEFLKSLHLIRRIRIGKKNYHLSHSYSLPERFPRELRYEELTEKQRERIVWDSIFDVERGRRIVAEEKPFCYKTDTYIFGHVFTQRLNHVDEEGRGRIYKNRSYRGYRVIDMDCGMALMNHSSRLGCIQLETGDEYYENLLV